MFELECPECSSQDIREERTGYCHCRNCGFQFHYDGSYHKYIDLWIESDKRFKQVKKSDNFSHALSFSDGHSVYITKKINEEGDKV